MKTAGIVIAVWLSLDLAVLAISAVVGAWRTHATRERARRFLAEDRLISLRDPLEDLWRLPAHDPRSTA